ncbi:unnamed protein product [Parnassius apollo]|uniref:unspecific monooxygenase n=1 Tax=Parnassius apollo TaxID=110799 RepID=A0A8S3WMB9_PARAO|nr:unnamed protein product [Parnassius apollo]
MITHRICKEFPKEPLIGAFYGTEPSLIVQDQEIIKLMTTKDFYFFNSREVANYTEKEIFTQNLFFTHGDKWKVIRQNLTPLFTSAKMKNMYYLIKKCARTNEIISFFKKLLIGVYENRQYKPSKRNDFVDLVLNLKENQFVTGDSITNLKTGEGKKVHLELNDDMLISQCVMFFVAGYETAATKLSFTLYELAKNEKTQLKTIAVVDEYLHRHEGKIEFVYIQSSAPSPGSWLKITHYRQACI